MSDETLWIYGLDAEQDFALSNVDGLMIEDRLGEVSSIEFTIEASDPRASLLLPDVLVRWRDRYFRVFELTQERSAGGATIRVYGEARWTDLGRKVRFSNFPVLGVTPLAGLVAILKGSGWTAVDGDAAADGVLYSREGFDESVLAHLRGWAEITGYELDFDEENLTVGLVDSVGSDRGVGFRYGSNVTQIRRRYEPPRATVLYGVGANSLTFESVHPDGEQYVEDFSWYVAQGLTLSEARALHTKEQVFVDSGFLLPLNLYDRTVERLAVLAQPIISYEASVVDLAEAVGGTGITFEIGDTVAVRDEVFGVDLTTRIVRRVYRPLVPGGDEVELSFLRTTDDSTETRERAYDSVSILVDKLDVDTTITAATDFAEIAVNTTGTSTVVVGATFLGTATGTGTVRFSFIVDTVAEGGEFEYDFVDGETVEFSFPSYVADLDAASHLLAFRASIIAGTGTIDVLAGEARGWALTTGAFGLGVNTSPNRRVVEELLEVSIDAMSGAFTVLLHPDVGEGTEHFTPSEAETVSGLSITALSDRYILPFIIGDPEFGELGSVGALS